MGIRPPPKPVSFTERDGRTKSTGLIIREVWIVEKHRWGDHCRVLQEIKFEGSKETYLRLGYYVKDHGAPDTEYIWGSQTAQIIKKKNFLRLVRQARRKSIL